MVNQLVPEFSICIWSGCGIKEFHRFIVVRKGLMECVISPIGSVLWIDIKVITANENGRGLGVVCD